MQNHHSLVYREEEREMFPTLDHFGVGIIPWSPLARGLLTRPFKPDEVTKRGDTDMYVSLCPRLNCLTAPVLIGSLLSIFKEWEPRRLSTGPFLPAKL